MITEVLPPKRGIDLTSRDASWFSQKVEQGRTEIFTEIITITPDIAKRLLEQNQDNRRPKERVITSIAKDIKAGHWELNGETIKVSTEGWLNDGQNRLLAIVRANEPVQTLVTFGLARKSRLTVDMGAARTTAEFLTMQKVPSANKIAVIARLNLIFKGGISERSNFNDTISKQDVIAHFELKRNEILISYREVGDTKFARSVSGQSALPVAYMNIRTLDKEGCEVFFEALASGANLDVGDPVLWLRARLIESTGEGLRSENRLEIILRYWNAWAQNQTLKKRIPVSGVYPKILVSKGKEK